MESSSSNNKGERGRTALRYTSSPFIVVVVVVVLPGIVVLYNE